MMKSLNQMQKVDDYVNFKLLFSPLANWPV